MIRNLKVLGLALVAVFAMSAMVASAASAANGMLTSTGPVTLDVTEVAGESNFGSAFGGVTKCPGSVGTGHEVGSITNGVPSGSSSITVTPDIEELTCNVVESGATHKMTVTMNGCDGVTHIGETTGVADTYRGTGDIVCPVGKSIIEDIYFSASNENLKVCEDTIGPQSGLSGPAVTDNTNGTLSIKGTTTGIKISKSGTCGAGTTESGELAVGLLVKGTDAAKGNTNISLSHL